MHELDIRKKKKSNQHIRERPNAGTKRNRARSQFLSEVQYYITSLQCAVLSVETHASKEMQWNDENDDGYGDYSERRMLLSEAQKSSSSIMRMTTESIPDLDKIEKEEEEAEAVTTPDITLTPQEEWKQLKHWIKLQREKQHALRALEDMGLVALTIAETT